MSVDTSNLNITPAATHAYCNTRVPTVNGHREICHALIDTLEAFSVPRVSAAAAQRPFHGACLAPAGGHAGQKLLNTRASIPEVARWLDAFASLGIGVVYVQIPYPLVTPAYADSHGSDGFLEFYKQVAALVRARGMMLVVHHTTVMAEFADSSISDVADYYATLTPARFRQEHAAGSARIAQALRPDYLILVAEPSSFEERLGFSFDTGSGPWWQGFVETSVAAVAPLKHHGRPRLGAGSGTWTPYTTYGERFNAIAGLDFIDLHIYSVYGGMLARAIGWPGRLAADSASRSEQPKEVVMSEAWLYKSLPTEVGNVAEVYARDSREYWAPLDGLFLSKLDAIARAKGYGFISPFWVQAFFAYLGAASPSPLLENTAPSRVISLWWQQASANIAAAASPTPTGNHYRELATHN